jgi:hypothetical protein
MTDRHECPAPGCTEMVAYDRLACRTHWFSLAKPLRDALWRAYNDHGVGSEAHAAAVGACIRALQGGAGGARAADPPAKPGEPDELQRRDAARAAELRRIADEIEGLPEPLTPAQMVSGLRDRAEWWERQAARRGR